ncbi:MAG TPA: peptidylprolyl isomerase [Streptomyces sp.]|nr:peptidylprolyl isomerase [Streptomyces sp.]
MVSSEQRRRQLARDRYLRQQQRRAEARRRARIRNAVIAGGLVLVLAAGGAYAAAGGLGAGKDKSEDNAAAEPSAPPTSKAPDPCGKPAKGSPGDKQWEKEPKLAIDTSATYTMTLETTCGDIVVEMDAAKAPHTVNSFDFLVGEGYLDHTKCHRLVTEGIHVLQCGDPTGTGRGGPGYTIPDENLKDPRVEDGTYPAGTVAMANTYNAQTGEGRDSGGSQFFLVYQDSPLPPDYTPFGTVTTGMDVLKKIADAGMTPDPQTGNTAPNATVVIDRATVRKE